MHVIALGIPPSINEAPISASTTSAKVFVDSRRPFAGFPPWCRKLSRYSGRHFWPVNGRVRINLASPLSSAARQSRELAISLSLKNDR